jgi:iron complex outermembrane recepter protein
VPKVRATVSATYEVGPYSGTIQTRVFGAAVYDAAYAQGYIDNNNVPAVAYLDLRGSMYLGELRQYQAYFAVDNILNTPPPSIPQLWSGTPYTVPTRPTIYDAIGTTLRVGLRWTL